MGYFLEKPYTSIEKTKFIIEHQSVGLTIEENENGIYALFLNEKIENNSIVEVEVIPYTPPVETEEERKARINALTLNSTTFYKEVLRTSNKSSNDIQQLIQNNTTLTNYQKESLFIDLQKSYTLIRGSYFVITIGSLLNYTTEQLDYLFEHKVFNF